MGSVAEVVEGMGSVCTRREALCRASAGRSAAARAAGRRGE